MFSEYFHEAYEENELRDMLMTENTVNDGFSAIDMLMIKYDRDCRRAENSIILEGGSEEELSDKYTEIYEGVGEAIGNIFNSICEAISSIFTSIKNFFTKKGVKSKLEELPADAQIKVSQASIENTEKSKSALAKFTQPVADLLHGKVSPEVKKGIAIAGSVIGAFLAISGGCVVVAKNNAKKETDNKDKEEQPKEDAKENETAEPSNKTDNKDKQKPSKQDNKNDDPDRYIDMHQDTDQDIEESVKLRKYNGMYNNFMESEFDFSNYDFSGDVITYEGVGKTAGDMLQGKAEKEVLSATGKAIEGDYKGAAKTIGKAAAVGAAMVLVDRQRLKNLIDTATTVANKVDDWIKQIKKFWENHKPSKNENGAGKPEQKNQKEENTDPAKQHNESVEESISELQRVQFFTDILAYETENDANDQSAEEGDGASVTLESLYKFLLNKLKEFANQIHKLAAYWGNCILKAWGVLTHKTDNSNSEDNNQNKTSKEDDESEKKEESSLDDIIYDRYYNNFMESTNSIDDMYRPYMEAGAEFSIVPRFKKLTKKYPELGQYRRTVDKVEKVLQDNGEDMGFGAKVGKAGLDLLDLLTSINSVMSPINGITFGTVYGPLGGFIVMVLGYLSTRLQVWAYDSLEFTVAIQQNEKLRAKLYKIKNSTDDKDVVKQCNKMIAQLEISDEKLKNGMKSTKKKDKAIKESTYDIDEAFENIYESCDEVYNELANYNF